MRQMATLKRAAFFSCCRGQLYAAALLSILLCGSAEARVTRIVIDSRSAAFANQTFGNVGPYELLRGPTTTAPTPMDRRGPSVCVGGGHRGHCPGALARASAHSSLLRLGGAGVLEWIGFARAHARGAGRGLISQRDRIRARADVFLGGVPVSCVAGAAWSPGRWGGARRLTLAPHLPPDWGCVQTRFPAWSPDVMASFTRVNNDGWIS
jgi:hypothetical protein